MEAEALPPLRLDASIVRLMVETAEGSAGERRHVFGGLNRFLAWCRRQKLIEHNICDDLDRDERPKPGKGDGARGTRPVYIVLPIYSIRLLLDLTQPRVAVT
jgi:hypothetical protein